MKHSSFSNSSENRISLFQKIGLRLANWTEKWFPDALVFAFLGVFIVFVLGLILKESPRQLIMAGGKGFWSLVPFTMQMMMVIVGGYVFATAPLIHQMIERVAAFPKRPCSAIVTIAFFSMLSSLLSWGFSLIFSALLVRAMARKIKGLDYRAAGAAAYLGLGAIWALGLSSSAALMMSSASSIPPELLQISGVLPLSQTLFLWQNGVMVLALFILSLLIAYFSAPQEIDAKTAQDFKIDLSIESNSSTLPTLRRRPGEFLEHHPLPNIMMAVLLGTYLIYTFKNSPQSVLSALDLNTYNLIFLTLGLLLHRTPYRFLKAVQSAVPATGSVLIQFPFYGMIFGMIVNTRISHWLSEAFVQLTTSHTYSLWVAFYSALLGVFIPSGGSKWIIEAPYILQAANLHQVHLGWVVQIYNAAEALPNLINPFWMLPLLAILGLKAKDIVGFCFLQMVLHIPLVFFLCWYFAEKMTYVAPVMVH